jgi:hypothetical protein
MSNLMILLLCLVAGVVLRLRGRLLRSQGVVT